MKCEYFNRASGDLSPDLATSTVYPRGFRSEFSWMQAVILRSGN